MPSREAILAGLALAANDSLIVAVAWHVAALVALLALAAGWRPPQRQAALLLSTPVASAAVVALAHGNPFNGSLLGGLAVVLAATASRLDQRPVRGATGPLAGVGAVSLAFGLVYPHFLDGARALYLVAAPTGLIPCPTLSVVIGFALVGGGFGAKAWSLALAAVGLFYGLFGVLRLGVSLDVGLILGAAALFVVALRLPRRVTAGLVGAGSTQLRKA
jgi:hypothetical protein